MSNKRWLGIKEKLLEPFIEWFGKHPLAVFVTIVLSVGGFLSATYAVISSHIEKTAQQAVMNEHFLHELAEKVRPVCIFDSRGSVLRDVGTAEYIESIDVIPIPENFGYQITLKMKKPVAYEPVLTAIGSGLHVLTAKRGKMHDWIFVLDPFPSGPRLIRVEGGMDTNVVEKFKLEIIH